MRGLNQFRRTQMQTRKPLSRPIISTGWICIVVGLIAYGIAWVSGLVRFNPQLIGLAAPYIGDSTSPLVVFVVNLALAATIVTVAVVIPAPSRRSKRDLRTPRRSARRAR